MNCSTLGFPILTISWSLLKLMAIVSMMPSNHFILCHPLLLLLSISPSIRVFSNQLALGISWPKYWSLCFNISPFNEYSDWFPLGWTGWISLKSKELSRVFSSTTVRKHQLFGTQPSLWPNSHIHTWLLEKWLLIPLDNASCYRKQTSESQRLSPLEHFSLHKFHARIQQATYHWVVLWSRFLPSCDSALETFASSDGEGRNVKTAHLCFICCGPEVVQSLLLRFPLPRCSGNQPPDRGWELGDLVPGRKVFFSSNSPEQ